MKTRVGFWLALIIAGLLAAATAIGQTIPVNAQGTTSLTTTEAYIGQYYFHSTDYGYLWLDTGPFAVGFVPVVGKPGLTAFPVTGYLLYGDCNGHGGLGTDGTVLVVNNFSGQCWSKFPDGARFFQSAFGFSPPSSYLPSYSTPVTGSPQQADPQGRRWGVQTLGGSQYAFYVIGTGPTPGPVLEPTWTPAPTMTAAPTAPAPAPTQPSGAICGPVSSGQCYLCGTSVFVACPESTLPTPTPTPTSAPPTTTPTGVPSTPSPTQTTSPVPTSAPTAASEPSASPTATEVIPPSATASIPKTPTPAGHGSAGGCGRNSSASLSGLIVGFALLYIRRKGSL